MHKTQTALVHTSLPPTGEVMTRALALIDQEGMGVVGTASEVQRENEVYIVPTHHVFQKAIGSGHLIRGYKWKQRSSQSV